MRGIFGGELVAQTAVPEKLPHHFNVNGPRSEFLLKEQIPDMNSGRYSFWPVDCVRTDEHIWMSC